MNCSLCQLCCHGWIRTQNDTALLKSLLPQKILLSQDTPQSGSRLCVLQTPAPRNNVADIIPISRCPSGGVETSVIYLHNDCIHLCGNVASWDAAAGQITRVVAQSHSGNQSRLHMNIYTSPMPIGCLIQSYQASLRTCISLTSRFIFFYLQFFLKVKSLCKGRFTVKGAGINFPAAQSLDEGQFQRKIALEKERLVKVGSAGGRCKHNAGVDLQEPSLGQAVRAPCCRSRGVPEELHG